MLEELGPQFERILLSFGVPEQDREDLLHDVLLAYILKANTIGRPQCWLPQALRLRCRQYWQVRLDRSRIEAAQGPQARTTGDPAQRLNTLLDLERSLAHLPARPRKVVRLWLAGRLSQKEIADKTGYAKASVDNTARRGLAYLRKRLGSAAYFAA